jgi:hypothetical protein
MLPVHIQTHERRNDELELAISIVSQKGGPGLCDPWSYTYTCGSAAKRTDEADQIAEEGHSSSDDERNGAEADGRPTKKTVSM